MKPTPLKPCPLCGGEAVRKYDPDDTMHLMGAVRCEKCGLTTGTKPRIAEAVKQWNARPCETGKAVAAESARNVFRLLAMARVASHVFKKEIDKAAQGFIEVFGAAQAEAALEWLKREMDRAGGKGGCKGACKAKAARKPVAKPSRPAKAQAPAKAEPAPVRKSARKGGRK